MTGRRPNIYWQACWTVISPAMLLVVLVAYVALQAQKHPHYPAWNPDYVSETQKLIRICVVVRYSKTSWIHYSAFM